MALRIDRYQSNSLDPGWPVILNDKDVNTSTCSLTLLGRRVAGYGEYVMENFVHLLENFAGPNPPSNPVTGQMWFRSTTNEFLYYDGSNWRTIQSRVNVVTSLPPSGQSGDAVLLKGTETATLHIHDGTRWVPVYFFDIDTSPPPSPKVGDWWYDNSTNRLQVYVGGGTWLTIKTDTPGGGSSTLDGEWNLHLTSNNVVVGVVEANGEIIAIFSPVTVSPGDLGIYTKKDGTTVPLATLFDRGVFPGMTFANRNYNIYANNTSFRIENVAPNSVIDFSINGFSYERIDDTTHEIHFDAPVVLNDPTYMVLPAGLSSDRPSSPLEGQFRYNLVGKVVEFYDGSNWVPLPTPSTVPSFKYKEIRLVDIVPERIWRGAHGLSNTNTICSLQVWARVISPFGGFIVGDEIFMGQGQQGFWRTTVMYDSLYVYFNNKDDGPGLNFIVIDRNENKVKLAQNFSNVEFWAKIIYL